MSTATPQAPKRRASRTSKKQQMDSTSTQSSRTSQSPAHLSSDLRRAMIADAAYYRAESRGFTPGDELEDWLIAERQVDAELSQSGTPAH